MLNAQETLESFSCAATYNFSTKSFVAFKNNNAISIPTHEMPNHLINPLRLTQSLNDIAVTQAIDNIPQVVPTLQEDKIRRSELKAKRTKTRSRLQYCETSDEVELYRIINRTNRRKNLAINAKIFTPVNVPFYTGEVFEIDLNPTANSIPESELPPYLANLDKDIIRALSEPEAYVEKVFNYSINERNPERALNSEDCEILEGMLKVTPNMKYTSLQFRKSTELYEKIAEKSFSGLPLHIKDKEALNELKQRYERLGIGYLLRKYPNL